MKLSSKTIIIIALSILVLAGIGFWVFREFTKPLPGQSVTDLGRGHVKIGTYVEYNSNPPTSGSHYEDWTRGGVYDSPKDDRNLVHSEEHGYIIVSYNCDFGQSNLSEISTTGKIELATDSAHLSENFKSEDCKTLVSQLTQIYNEEGKNKIIVVPRPILDSKLALTTWGRNDKWNPQIPLTQEDISRVKHFIEVLRDHGPEKTME
jgi:hypothetical protein